MRFPQASRAPSRAADDREEFRQFAAASQGHLRRSAYLLCGDWHFAEDLVQNAFDRIYRHWHRVRAAENPDAYARQIVYRCFLDSRKKRHVDTVSFDHLPEGAEPGPAPETRLAVLDALATLPARTRAVVVLRYWEDLSVEQTAGLLGISSGSVKSMSSRGLELLRPRLADFADARPASAENSAQNPAPYSRAHSVTTPAAKRPTHSVVSGTTQERGTTC